MEAASVPSAIIMVISRVAIFTPREIPITATCGVMTIRKNANGGYLICSLLRADQTAIVP